MDKCEHGQHYYLDFANQPRAFDRCYICERDAALLKLEPSQMLVREIVAYFDMLENMGRKPLGGPDYWPTDWLRRAKESLK